MSNKISKIVLRSLFSKPSTAMYPIKKREFYERTRGCVTNEIDNCIFCGLCSRKCPTGALTVSRDQKQWTIDRFRCILCGECVTACPKKCLNMENPYATPVTEKDVEMYAQAENKAQ
jgi:ech hydrogenase subunit F